MSVKNNFNYDIEKSANKLIWRFRKENGIYKSFTPNDNDVECLNTLIQCINREKRSNLKDNELFAKLFIYHMVDSARKYNVTTFNGLLQKDICKTLDRPLKSFYDAFINDIKVRQIENIIDVETKNTITVDKFNEIYTDEYVKSKLDMIITEALNRF